MEDFLTNKIAVVASVILLIMLFASIFCFLIAPFDPYDLKNIHIENSLLPPLSRERASGRQEHVISIQADRVQDSDGILKEFSYTRKEASEEYIHVIFTKMVSNQVRIRKLTPGITVQNAEQHPITKIWTLAIEESDSVDIVLLRVANDRDAVEFELNVSDPIRYTGKRFFLGTDEYGRDVFSTILYGMRVSLYVGFISGLIALVIGVALGLISAWKGGKVDAMLTRLVDLQQSFPAVLIGILLVAILGKGLSNMIIVLVIIQWSFYVRTVRSIVLVEKNKDYIKICPVLGLPVHKIVLSHLLPNCVPQIIVMATMRIAAAITLESTLSFLGLGLPPTRPSLGVVISQGYAFMLSRKLWMSLYPGFALLILIMCVSIVGDHMRVVLNPYSRR